MQIAGSPVSTQRAFIMTSLVMLAILIDRKADIMRLIAIAAIILIIISPENILKPSFQMSFFAVLGICSSFSRLLKSTTKDIGPVKKSINFFIQQF